ncbi:MAG: hypothetical protein K6G38_05755 [Gammaproteobacteria bacterium]|nr:hypothetical protein [Gammaproteobacteria bacterium]
MILSDIINLTSIIAFLIGILSGIMLMISTIIILFSLGSKEKKKVLGPTIEAIDDEKIEEMILNKQNALRHELDDNDQNLWEVTYKLALELVHEVAAYYFPNSPYPEFELNVYETGDFINYVIEGIEKMFDKSIFKLPVLKKVKTASIAEILKLIKDGKKVADSKAFKSMGTATEMHSEMKAVKNSINPIYWFKRVVVNGSLNYALRKIALASLSIVGNEANKVYSKKLFKKDVVTDTTDEMIQEIFNDEGEV